MNSFLLFANSSSRHSTVLGLALTGIFLMSGVRKEKTPEIRFVGLREIQSKYGFTGYVQKDSTVNLKSRTTTVAFETDSRKMMINGTLVWLNDIPVKQGRNWYIGAADANVVLDPLLRSNAVLASSRCSRIVLDPGHGGKDTGAIGQRKVYEKKVVLDISKRVVRKLKGIGVDIVLTRNGDTDLPLKNRSKIASKEKADLFVSIHVNSAHNLKASGIETYVLPQQGYPSTSGGKSHTKADHGNKHDKASSILAYCIQKSLVSSVNAIDRGVKRARFEVLKEAPCTAVLVECGFVSNKSEEALMIKASHRDKLATGIAKGILMYISKTADKP